MLGASVLINQRVSEQNDGTNRGRLRSEELYDEDRSGVYTTGSSSSDGDDDNDWTSITKTLWSIYNYVARKPLLYCVIIYVVWISIGVTFFSTYFGSSFLIITPSNIYIPFLILLVGHPNHQNRYLQIHLVDILTQLGSYCLHSRHIDH